MVRQRTKVAEWWEWRDSRVGAGFEPPLARYDDKGVAQRWMQSSNYKRHHYTLHHVTRYRLAPLVRLRWVQSLDDCFLDATDGNVCRASVRPDYDEWCARVWHDDYPVYAATLAEAKAACAARLRELGYRVVDE